MYLSVIIPAYNEARRLPKTLEKVDEYLREQTYDYEVIVVNDGSRDKTAEVVKNLQSQIKNLRLIDNKENHGKGYVVRQGILAASGEYRVFTDADNSTSIDQVERMWPEFKKGYDIVIGSRDVNGAVLDPPQPWIRNIILGEGFKLFRKIIIGLWKIEDSQCGFKGITRAASEKIFPKCKIDRFAFDPEILVIANKLGYKIKEIPIHWKNDPESKVKFKSIIRMAIDLIQIRLNSVKGLYGV
ncbi:MAG TPA: glycosyltransferase family 2 protein [Candidatus Nealsonbacteria bacterium]|uniref:dolichyl-phosphate beta-glucosyltransferase n=1 Tax=marine sediment metagenome TaxID=412755 RepID=A0A0F9YEQ4_9ZZZZ|nr:glycosyltransferase family 2 protein [Candidatus Nealsonbacteria bacterium]HEB46342.1 glycosyltransferase family 2 protein [Candidatus Nealsonbacteria bacterium]